MKQPKRLAWIDYVKVFAIFFVVLVHVDCSPLCTKVLKAFLMPLFFILSGYLFSYERNPKYKPFALKRFRQIIIPYAWISTVTYLLWFFVLRKFGNNPNDAVAWYVPVAGTFAGMPPLLVHDIPLWSLVSFFVVEMIYYPLRKCLKSDIGIAAIAFLTAWAISSLIPDISPYLPFALAPSIAGLGFYALGRLLRTRATHTGLGNAKSNLVALAALIAFVISLKYNVASSFYKGLYGIFPLYLISAVSGAWLMIWFSKAVSAGRSEPGLIRFISTGTLLVCGFHLITLALIKGVMLFGFGIPPAELTDGVLRGTAVSLVAMALTFPIIYVVRRYARFLVDK